MLTTTPKRNPASKSKSANLAPHGREKSARSGRLQVPEMRDHEQRGVPIRLTQTPARCRVRPRAGIKVGIGQRSGRNAGRQSTPKIGSGRRVIGKQLLKLRERPGK